MARARNIKPGFFTNGDLLECQPLARLLFAGLWTEADCRGILEDRPKTLKIKLLPGDNCDVDELLNELQSAGFIRRYEVDGVRCILVTNFEKHQNPHINEKQSTLPAPEQHDASTLPAPEQHDASTLPAPEQHDASTLPAPEQHDASTLPAPEQHDASTLPAPEQHDASTLPAPEQHQSAPAESIYITDSLTLNPSAEPTLRAGARAKEPRSPGGFERFWDRYPRKTGKQDAERVFGALDPPPELLAEILAAIERQKTWQQWSEGFVPNPATWLRGKRWQDEEPPKRGNGTASSRASPAKDDIVTRNLRNLGVLDDEPAYDDVIEPKWSVSR